MTPHRTILLGSLLMITVRDAYELIGLPKSEQATKIARFASFHVEGRKWEVRKSRNLPYHPATYTLRIEL